MKKISLLFLAIFLLFSIFFSFYDKKVENYYVILGVREFSVEIADSDSTRERGLSGHRPLLNNEGMLFIFEKEGSYPFWMKEMLFPIDILWIDKNFKVNHIESSVLPETYPKVFSGKDSTLYVLEIMAGESDELKIKTGDEIKFVKK